MVDTHRCGCGHDSKFSGIDRHNQTEEVDLYRCECGTTSAAPRIHCGKPMEKIQ